MDLSQISLDSQIEHIDEELIAQYDMKINHSSFSHFTVESFINETAYELR